MNGVPFIEAELVLLSQFEGGRKRSLDLTPAGTYYRPHIVVGDRSQRKVIVKDGNVIDEQYLGVQFRSMPQVVAPGESATVTMDLIYHPRVSYEQLKPGVEFTLREGGTIVGHGVVKRVFPK